MQTAWSVSFARFPPVDPIRLKIRLKPVFGHEKTPETSMFREFWLEVTPGFELERGCNMVYHAVTKACISNALQVLAVNAVSCCKSCKGYGKG